MGVDHPDVSTRPPSRGTPRPIVGLAWALAVLAMVALLVVGLAIVSAIQERRPHALLSARFTTTTFTRSAVVAQTRSALWTDSQGHAARLQLSPGQQTVYYVRDHGTWYAVARSGATGAWRRTTLRKSQVPSLLDESAVRALFARLRVHAGNSAVGVVLNHHMAVTFTTTGVTWPFPSAAPVQVWLDDMTGLPVQFRTLAGPPPDRTTSLTRIDLLRAVSSASLGRNFFTSPDRPPTPWQRLVDAVDVWLGLVTTAR